MHFAPSADQLALRDAVRALLERACPPAVVRQAWTRPDETLWSLLGAQGVIGVEAPESVGGLGLGPCEWAPILEEAGRFAAPVPLIEAVAVLPLLAEVDPELAARVVAGDARVGLAHRDGYAVDADRAEVILLMDGPQVHAVRGADLDAVPCLDHALRWFSLSGGDRRPLPAVGRALGDRAAVAAAAQLLGIADRLLELTVVHAKARHQFGRAIGSFQAVQHHLVDALLALRFAQPAVARAAWSLAVADPARSRDAAMAKALASDAARTAARKALQVHGAIGYTFEYDLHLWMKRAWALGASWGDALDHRERIAAEILDDPGGAHA